MLISVLAFALFIVENNLCTFIVLFFSPSDVLVQKTERAKGTKGTQQQRYTSALFHSAHIRD